MAWFRNYYRCERCEVKWKDQWSCTCDDDCRVCGARHTSPYRSDDLTLVIEEKTGAFTVLRSPETAEHSADYEAVSEFRTRELAEAFVRDWEE